MLGRGGELMILQSLTTILYQTTVPFFTFGTVFSKSHYKIGSVLDDFFLTVG